MRKYLPVVGITLMLLAIAVGLGRKDESPTSDSILACCHTPAELAKLKKYALSEPSGEAAYALAGYFDYNKRADSAGILSWYREAASKGHVEAQLTVGRALARQALGACFDKAKADEARLWFNKSLRTPHSSAIQVHQSLARLDKAEAEDYACKTE